MKWLAKFFLIAVTGLVAAACDGPDTVPITPSSTKPRTLEGYYGKGAPTVHILVVDDADTPEAALLRTRVVQALRVRLLALVGMREEGCAGTLDPAEWRPGDDRVIIVRPSAPTSLSIVTPIDMPALGWTTITSKAEEAEAVVAAAAEALEQRLAKPDESYHPLRAASRALDLVSGLQGPATEAEEAFVASLAEGTVQTLFVASTRDDEDVMPPADLIPNPVSLSSTYPKVMVLPAETAQFTTCGTSDNGNTRLEAWGDLVGTSDHAWPCDDDAAWDGMFHPGFADCGLLCMERPILVAESGAAACKIHVDQPDLASCDPVKGWRDPGGKETIVERFGQTLRRCEVVQHQGAALEACRTSPDCPGCASGFCVTDVVFYENTNCPDGTYLWNFRFTGGARSMPYGRLEVTCSEAAD